MKLQMLGVIFAVCAGVGPAFAQSGSTAAPPPSQSREAAGTVRVTGCVERADQVTPQAGAALGTTVDSQEFVLIRSEIAGTEPAAASSPTGTTGVSGAAARRPDDFGQMFRLDAAPALMNPHVGHRVEITGSRDSATQPPAAQSSRGNPAAAPAPLLRVASIKTIADTCVR